MEVSILPALSLLSENAYRVLKAIDVPDQSSEVKIIKIGAIRIKSGQFCNNFRASPPYYGLMTACGEFNSTNDFDGSINKDSLKVTGHFGGPLGVMDRCEAYGILRKYVDDIYKKRVDFIPPTLMEYSSSNPCENFDTNPKALD
jgi:hypothetical protein